MGIFTVYAYDDGTIFSENITADDQEQADEKAAALIEERWHFAERDDFETLEEFMEEYEISADPRPDLDQAAVERDTLLAIQSILSGKMWSPDTLDDIAEAMRSAGFEIADVDEGDDEEQDTEDRPFAAD